VIALNLLKVEKVNIHVNLSYFNVE